VRSITRGLGSRWAWLALAVVVTVTVAWVAWPSGSESVDARADRLASELRCVECEGLSVADANTTTAEATRADIRERIEAGESDAEIRQAYIDRYGDEVLLNPSNDGISVAVWALPVIVVILGAAGVTYVVWRGQRTPRRSASPDDEALVADAARPDIDRLAADPRASERDFLLRSLDDLDAEYAAGDVDPESYTTLHADYTARTAVLLRARDDLEAVPPSEEATPATSRPTGRRLLVGSGVVAFACLAGVLLAFALGARLPGDLPSGNEAAVSSDEREARLRDAVEANPEDPTARLTLANYLSTNDDFAGALEQYDAAAALDPTDPQAPAQAGWILFITAAGATDAVQQAELLNGARERLDRAVTIDPEYPDAHFYRGVVLYRGYGDAAAAVPELQRYLVLAPDTPLAEEVREVLAEAVAVSESLGAGSTVPVAPE